jgi:diacylglycerol O-acyltransferase / wax synthase
MRGLDRATGIDLMQQASGRGSAPMQVGGVLVLRGRTEPELVRAAIAERIRAVPRLRRRLVSVPFGAGRPVWVDDPAFDIDAHVRVVRCPAPGGEAELLSIAADLLTHALPRDRPLWSVTLVDGLADGRSALVVMFDHVLADGIGGLFVLSRLVDGPTPVPDSGFPATPPQRAELFADALRSRIRAVRRLPAVPRMLAAAWAELAPSVHVRAPPSSLNQPTGPDRQLGVVRTDLDSVRQIAHAYGGTINDVVLAAATGALHDLLAGRGESIDSLVVSIPVSSRRRTADGRLGNAVGVLPIELPAAGDPAYRLDRIARIVHDRKTDAPGASSAVLAPVLRMLAATGLFDRYVTHQRRINTLVTNVRGPGEPLTFLGVPIAEIIPVTTTTGNVTVSFAVFSYAGRLTVSVVADPVGCPDLPTLVSLLQNELRQAGAGCGGAARPVRPAPGRR